MQYVVDEGGGGNARIAGYRVGGKTGTANKINAGTGKYGKDYYSSFIGMAPMDDPQVSILVIADSPKGSYYGSMDRGTDREGDFDRYPALSQRDTDLQRIQKKRP